MPYSLKQAADATGKSKPTILRAIQTSKISAEKDVHGEWQIDPAELHRVYLPVSVRNASPDPQSNDTQHSAFPFEMGVLSGEVEQLRERLNHMDLERERERREASDQIEDLRKRLDQSEAERRTKDTQLTALLTDQRPKPNPAQPDSDPPAPPPQAEPIQSPAAAQTPMQQQAGLWSRLRYAVTRK